MHQKAKGLTEKSIGDYKLTMEWAFSAISRNKPLKAISKDDIRTFRNLLGNLPKNMDKNEKTKGLSAAEAAAKGADLEKLAYRTKRKRFLAFTSLFHWALQEGKLDVDVSLGISIETPPKGAKEKSRIPYSTQQLKQIFSHPIFRGRNSTQYNLAGAYLVKDYLFWVPLIALFSGMRQGEILQLTKADIRQENGVRYFDVNKSERDGYGGAKTLKTASSERKVPIHPVLVDLGFLEYVEKQENGRIFSTAKLGSDGTYSQYFSKQWRAIAVAGGFYQRKTVFHSFRHSFIDACRNAKVPENLAEQIVGHKEGSTHSSYGSGASLDVLQGEVAESPMQG